MAGGDDDIPWAGSDEPPPHDGEPGGDAAPAPKGKSAGKKKGAMHPNRVALQLIEHYRLISDLNGTIYLYDQNYWRELSETQVENKALGVDGDFNTLASRRTEVRKFIAARQLVDPLVWSRVADDEVPCANTVYNVRSGDMRAHDPEDMLDRVVPIPFKPGAKCDLWLKTLTDWFGSPTSEEACALQEFFGYIVLPHAKFKKALVVQGETNCGKSLVPFVARALVGEKFTCSLPVEHMDNPFRRYALKGKALNNITELPSSAVIKDGGFKALVSQEDPVSIEAKFKNSETYMPTAKHLICCNRLPRITDRTEATIGRLLIVPFTRTFDDSEQDHALGEKLMKELPGILLWAIDGAKRLIERGGIFLSPASGSKLIADLREEINPIRLFLRENCVVDSASAIPLRHVAERFNIWNADPRNKLGAGQIGKRLRLAGQSTKDVRHGDNVLKSLVGFRLSADHVPTQLQVDENAAIDPADEILGWQPGQVRPGKEKDPY